MLPQIKQKSLLNNPTAHDPILSTRPKGRSHSRSTFNQKKYCILEKNFRYRKSEIDLIVRQNNLVIAVEIKTRSSSFFGAPASFLKYKQQQRIVEALDYYIRQNNLEVEVRFDTISIVKTKEGFEVEHIENAFYHF